MNLFTGINTVENNTKTYSSKNALLSKSYLVAAIDEDTNKLTFYLFEYKTKPTLNYMPVTFVPDDTMHKAMKQMCDKPLIPFKNVLTGRTELSGMYLVGKEQVNPDIADYLLQKMEDDVTSITFDEYTIWLVPYQFCKEW